MGTKKIRDFLSSIADIDFRYLRIQISMANDARELIKKFDLSKADFCKRMQISPRSYNKYRTGGYNYSIKNMAYLQAAYCDLEMEETRKEAEKMFTDVLKNSK